jgi:hypothetical protein
MNDPVCELDAHAQGMLTHTNQEFRGIRPPDLDGRVSRAGKDGINTGLFLRWHGL